MQTNMLMPMVAVLICLSTVVARAGSADTSARPPGTLRKLTPLFDRPLRDTAVTRGDDGTYYLTGTACAGMSGEDSYLSGFKPDDFRNNDGVWLWKSEDMKEWEPVGQVWSIFEEVKKSPSIFHARNRWQTDWNVRHDVPESPKVRAMTSPELHQIKGNFYICYAMNENGTGLLKSKSGKAEGPYEDLGMITWRYGSPSMFADDDGTVYWLWGDGWIAKMKEDLTGLAEQPRRMTFEPDSDPGKSILSAGQGGMFMFKADIPGWSDRFGEYHLVYRDTVARMAWTACRDTHISSADSPYGPFTPRRLMVPHGGQATVFQDDAGSFFSTFSGSDDWAVFRDKPGIVPLVEHNEDLGNGNLCWFAGALMKPDYPVTAAGAWDEMEPLLDRDVRDFCILNAPDGYYYLTGSDPGYNYHEKGYESRDEVGIKIWRSKDLKNWEDMGQVWKADDHPFTRDGLTSMIESYDDNFPPFIIFDTEFHYLKGTYWLLASMSFRKGRWWDDDGMAILLLKSTSGKAEGPYELHWRDTHADRGRFWTPNLFQDDDGKCYLIGGGMGNNISLLNDDLTGIEKHLPAMFPEGGYEIGEGGHIQKIGDTYFFTTAKGTNPRRGGIGERPQMCTYDLIYSTAKSIRGPWSPTKAVPRCGNSRLFRDKNGQWYGLTFGSHPFGPLHARPAIIPVEVKDDRIIPER